MQRGMAFLHYVFVPTSGASGCLQAPSRLLPPCPVQVWKYPKVWEGFIKCCQRTKPQSFQVILQLPPQQLGAVFDKCPRSVIAKEEIKEGTVISEDMLTYKRPGTGISPSELDKIIGKKAKMDIAEDELIKYEYLE